MLYRMGKIAKAKSVAFFRSQLPMCMVLGYSFVCHVFLSRFLLAVGQGAKTNKNGEHLLRSPMDVCHDAGTSVNKWCGIICSDISYRS